MNKQTKKHKIRQNAILTAAEVLFIRYGYDKTSVTDIAKHAGISKGAIYLNFKSKDALFEKLIVIQLTKFGYRWMTHIEDDPQGGTMARIYINMLYAMNGHDFISHMVHQDNHLFGSYLRKPNNIFKDRNQLSTKHEFIILMQQAGCIRKDLDPITTAHVMNILSYGLVSMEQIMHKDDIPPAEDVIKTIAEIMDRALTPKDGGNSDAGKAIIRQLFDAGVKQFNDQTDN